jgi:hypothetical protein
VNEDIFFIGGFFFTTIVLAIGVPLVRSYVRRREAEPPASHALTDQRLARMEQTLDALAIEVERISEGQRFVTKLLAEREKSPAALPASEPRQPR